MHVGSLLEIYTTMFGWSIYDTIFKLFTSTGLIIFPFIMMLIRNWSEPLQTQNERAASLVSQTRVNYDALAMLAVFMVAVVPVQSLTLHSMDYQVACTDNTGAVIQKQNVAGGSTGTTYDNTLSTIGNVRIPVLWWLVLSVGSGVNSAISSSFTCFEDIDGLDKQLRSLKLKDPHLRNEYMRFARECFIPAKSKYVNAMQGNNHFEDVKLAWDNFISSKGRRYSDDWMYIGSHFYLTTPGFYKAFNQDGCNSDFPAGCGIKAEKPVKGWPVNQARDHYPQSIIDHPDPANPLYGKPYCDEWWTDSVRGIKTKLLKSIEADKQYMAKAPPRQSGESWVHWLKRMIYNGYGTVMNGYANLTFTDSQLDDMIINNYVARDPPTFTPSHGGLFGGNDFANVHTDTQGQNFEKAGAVAAGLATAVAIPEVGIAAAKGIFTGGAQAIAGKMADFYIDMFIAKQAAPMVQALLLMMIYMFLLFYMVMSAYDVEATIMMIFIILGIQFFTTIWNLTDYLDARLFVSMFPDATVLGSILTMGTNRFILNIVLSLMYIVAPFILLWVMGMAGSKVGSLGSNIGPLGRKGSTGAGSQGVNKGVAESKKE